MMDRRKILCAVLAVGLLTAGQLSADQFDLDIRAQIAPELAIVGWGFDAWYDEAQLTFVDATFGPDWTEVAAQDPDPDDATVDLNLAAISFPPGAGITGNVLLATLTFEADSCDTLITLGDHNALGDLCEGFAIDPALGGGFAEFDYPDPFSACCCVVTIYVPEPGSLSLLAVCGLIALRRR